MFFADIQLYDCKVSTSFVVTEFRHFAQVCELGWLDCQIIG